MIQFFFLLFSLKVFILGSLFAQESSIIEIKGLFKTHSTFNKEIQMVDKPLLYDNGILFTYYGDKDDKVYLSGDFNEWREKIRMKGNSIGIFYYFLTTPLKKGDYKYRYMVNGIWINDQEQPFYKVDTHNQRVSYFNLPRDIIFIVPISPEPLENGKYRFYLKDEGYQKVSLISDANHWEPGITPMTLDNGYWYVDYYWGNRKLFYAYWVDGEKKYDPYNLSRVLTSFNLSVNSYIPAFRSFD